MLTQGHQNVGTLVTWQISHLKMMMSISEGFWQVFFFFVGPVLLMIYAKQIKDPTGSSGQSLKIRVSL